MWRRRRAARVGDHRVARLVCHLTLVVEQRQLDTESLARHRDRDPERELAVGVGLRERHDGVEHRTLRDLARKPEEAYASLPERDDRLARLSGSSAAKASAAVVGATRPLPVGAAASRHVRPEREMRSAATSRPARRNARMIGYEECL